MAQKDEEMGIKFFAIFSFFFRNVSKEKMFSS
jgi:hypothetical protein